MTSIKASVLGGLAAILLSSSAYASDIYGSAKDSPATAASSGGVVNWTGFYIGGRLGYGHANHDLTVESYQAEASEVEAIPASCADPKGESWNGTENDCQGGYDPGSPMLPAIDGLVQPLFGLNGLDTSGLTGGGQIGFDISRGRFVFGLFGAYDLSTAETTVSLADTEIKAIEKGDEWSVGARLGYIVAPRTLTYVLAAYTQSDFSFSGAGDTKGVPNGQTKDVTFDGLTLGGGIEFALTSNVFFGIEGTHTFYGKEVISDFHNNEDRGRVGVRTTDEIDETKVMGTLKIKLNGGGTTGLGF